MKNKREKIWRSRIKSGTAMLGFFGVLVAAVWINSLLIANAQISLPSGVEDAFPVPSGHTAVVQIKNLTAKIADNVRTIIGAIAIIIIVISGVKMVTAQGNEEVYTKQQTTLLYAIIGLLIVGLAGEITEIFEVDHGGFLRDPNVALQKSKLFNRQVQIIITFIKYIIGSVAVLFVVRSSLRMVFMGDKEEELAKDKKNIYWGLIGLVIILVSNPIINQVFFKIDTSKFPGNQPVRPGIDTGRLILEIAGMTNIIAAITGPMAILSLIIGGLMYIFAGGDEGKMEKAKKLIMWSVVGILIIYGAFAIVSTFISRRFEGL